MRTFEPLLPIIVIAVLHPAAAAAAAAAGGISAAAAADPVCSEQLSSCSCRLSDGRLLDLSPLQASPGPAFDYAAPDGYTYQFNPCSAYRCGTEDDAAVCQEKLQIIIQYADFGIQSSAKFEIDPASSQLRLRFQSRDATKTTLVNLHCDPAAADATISSQGAQDTQLTMDLTSRFACPTQPATGGGGMSGGDVLLIVVFVTLAVYLLAGVLVNRLVRGRTGALEVLPNVAFWSSLPGLVVDGAVFVYRRARGLVGGGGGGGGGQAGYSDIK